MAVIVGILLVAVVAGVFGSMLGVGGGIIMVPVLSLAFGVPIKTAIATSIVCVIATSSMAQTTFAARGMTNMRLGMFLEVATTVGAVAGGVTAVLIDGRFLQVAFAVVLFYVAWQMSRRRGDVVAGGERRSCRRATTTRPRAGRSATACTAWASASCSRSCAGNVSGLLGVGGGAFKVPIMNLLMGVPLKATIATSNLMIGVTAATGAAIFYGRGYMDPQLGRAGRARHPRRRAARAAAGDPPAGAGPRHRLRGRARRLRRAHAAQGAGGGRVSQAPARRRSTSWSPSSAW